MMRVGVNMTEEKEFNVSGWWGKKPAYVLETLQSQLDAAAAVWPELRGYEIRKRSSSHGVRGTAGGHARAAALSPEQRAAQASKAAKARWGNK